MKERPILFSSSMVRGLLEGRKTETRRPVKPQPPCSLSKIKDKPEIWTYTCSEDEWKCPFGIPGDGLWMRETWVEEKTGGIHYRATVDYYCIEQIKNQMKWKPSIHMPRWASRIDLEITSVNVERLQGVTEQDADAEGFERREHFIRGWDAMYSKKPEFQFAVNPWVWIIQFKRINP